ncbi:MAG TPA: hypothetical protein VFN30_04570 [Chitinophagaceae bacterium]|nr:hypothetical protein [Chitinophagaceae bacterium]
MRTILTLKTALIAAFLFSACRSSKNFVAKGTTDEIVFKAVRFLNKHPEDVYALGELKFNYSQAVKNHEEKIAVWKNSSDANRWDKIITELSVLQNMYDAINSSANLIRATKAQSYFNALAVAKDSAASQSYQSGLAYLNKEGRDNAKSAYQAFKKANGYVTDYKDSRDKMKEAFDKSIVLVVINPVHDDNLFLSGWNNSGLSYNREYLQQLLVRDLGGDYSTSNPAKFYTDWDARRKNINPDWIIDLTWQSLYASSPTERTYSRNVSKKIESGKDTSGKPIYQTVKATLHITRLSYTANGDLEYQITDVKQKKNVDAGRLPASFNWQHEYATYTGDSRALDSNDWALINSSRQYQPYNSKDEILNELSKRVYNDLKYRVRSVTNW